MGSRVTAATVAAAVVVAIVRRRTRIGWFMGARTASAVPPAGPDGRRQTRFQRHLAGQQRGALGFAGSRARAPEWSRSRACIPYDYAQVAAAPVLALGAAGRRTGIDRRRRGRRRDSVQAGSGGDQEGERRALDRSRSRAQVLPAGLGICRRIFVCSGRNEQEKVAICCCAQVITIIGQQLISQRVISGADWLTSIVAARLRKM